MYPDRNNNIDKILSQTLLSKRFLTVHTNSHCFVHLPTLTNSYRLWLSRRNSIPKSTMMPLMLRQLHRFSLFACRFLVIPVILLLIAADAGTCSIRCHTSVCNCLRTSSTSPNHMGTASFDVYKKKANWNTPICSPQLTLGFIKKWELGSVTSNRRFSTWLQFCADGALSNRSTRRYHKKGASNSIAERCLLNRLFQNLCW